MLKEITPLLIQLWILLKKMTFTLDWLKIISLTLDFLFLDLKFIANSMTKNQIELIEFTPNFFLNQEITMRLFKLKTSFSSDLNSISMQQFKRLIHSIWSKTLKMQKSYISKQLDEDAHMIWSLNDLDLSTSRTENGKNQRLSSKTIALTLIKVVDMLGDFLEWATSNFEIWTMQRSVSR